jgi:putative ATP-binding cassette transporter
MAFAQLIGAFSLIVNQFPQLSSYAAVLARLNALGEAHQAAAAPSSGNVAIGAGDSRFAFEELTLRAPQDDRPLVRGLSVEVPARTRLLVAGADDLVTRALLRAVAGLWRTGTGRVVRPRQGELLLLPERPYLPPGTLRELFTHDAGPQPTPEDRIWEALRRVEADAAVRHVGGLDVQRDWNGVLSLDEQRLISVAHLLLAAPRFAVLAHPAAGRGAERAADVLAALTERGVGYVVLGNGAFGHDAFDAVVEIAPDGTWTRTGAPDPPPSGAVDHGA